MSAARRAATLFAGVVTGWLLANALLNWVVNPWGYYEPRLVPPRVVDDRREKLALLRRMQPPPEQLILGSSRMLRFEPARLEARTGLRTFNAAISGAAPVDALAIYRFATEELRLPVRSLLVGVELPAFTGRRRNYGTLAANPQLRRFLPGGTADEERFRAAGLLLNWSQTEDSLTSLAHALGASGPRRLWRDVAEDGFLRRSHHDAKREAPGWRLDRAIAAQIGARYLKNARTAEEAFADLSTFLRVARRRGTTVTLLATPTLEQGREYWRRIGTLGAQEACVERLRTLAAAHSARFVDFSDARAFGGDPGQFYDAVHPTVLNTRRMIDAAFPSPLVARSALRSAFGAR